MNEWRKSHPGLKFGHSSSNKKGVEPNKGSLVLIKGRWGVIININLINRVDTVIIYREWMQELRFRALAVRQSKQLTLETSFNFLSMTSVDKINVHLYNRL